MRDIDSLPGDSRFKDEVWHLLELHARKQADYGTEGDSLANLRASQEFGVPAWIGGSIRLNDKVKRVKSMALNGKLENESIADSFDDIAVYAILNKILWREEQPGMGPAGIHYMHEPREDCGLEGCPWRH